MTDVSFPVMSAEHQQTEGVVSTWFVEDGESVAEDQVLAEVQVDKVSAEVLAPYAGTIRLLVPEGTVVKQGQPIARLE
jgi:pyruvate/2-oxoglutarate dehydrogenase complex dihydrolipoamide acyltransferase (E2) component